LKGITCIPFFLSREIKERERIVFPPPPLRPETTILGTEVVSIKAVAGSR
jgi:hypothetical protein